MEAAAAAAGGGSGGGPAPFLIKTYEMVDDSSTDDIVSWSSTNASFVVWNPPEFAANLLPTYFKHNNFSSFIRQLNTYGFRKIDPERWEFANDDFIKDHKHLLKNIHRRKPIHSHSHPPAGPSPPDPERIALEEEIDRLTREKAALTADLWRFKQQQSGTKIQLDDVDRRLYDVEQRQSRMISFLDRALRNPKFVQNLIKMSDSGAPTPDFSLMLHKKRRLPAADYCLEAADSSSFYDNNSSSSSPPSKPDVGHVFNQDFCDKLQLGLCPAAAISDNNLVSATMQCSDEGGGSPPVVEQNVNGRNGRMECRAFVLPDASLSDTGISICPRKNALFPGSADDGDGLFPCHLNLTLASSSMQIDDSSSFGRDHDSMPKETISNEARDTTSMELAHNQNNAAGTASGNATSVQEAAQASNQAPQAAPGRVNDVFWEQFLTERPGSSDTEEASSSFRSDPGDGPQDEMKSVNDSMMKNKKDMEQLTL